MKTYVITLSKTFPKDLPNGGEPTNFEAAFNAGQDTPKGDTFAKYRKLHTIRANYELWAKRFEKIESGEACLSVRQWVGKPYGKGSTQRELARLTRKDGIGIQMLRIENLWGNERFLIGDTGYEVRPEKIAHNDGLGEADWRNWFSYYDLTKPLAVLHFTKFRY